MTILIIIILVVGVIAYFKIKSDPEEVQKLCEGKNEQIKEVIRYLYPVEGCGKKAIWTDEQFDDYLKSKIQDLQKRALDKIGIDIEQVKEVEPIHLENNLYSKAMARRGNDRRWRSSRYQVTWIFFSDKQILLYQKTIDLINQDSKERTEEYFYKDVTNIKTIDEEERLTINGEKQTVNYVTFKIVVPGEEFACAMQTNDYTERSIQAMKAKLREKKC